MFTNNFSDILLAYVLADRWI